MSNLQTVLKSLKTLPLEEAKKLPVPTDFPTLRGYQKSGAYFLYLARNAILADPCGSGKSLCALVSLLLGIEKSSWKKFCIVAPGVSLRQWQDEASKFSLKSTIIRGTPAQRRAKWIESRSVPVSLVSYQTLVSDKEQFKKIKWDAVVFDECTAFKNSDTVRAKTIIELRKFFPNAAFMGLSATPMNNNYMDLHSVFSCLGVDLGPAQAFMDRYCVIESRELWLPSRFAQPLRSGHDAFCPRCHVEVPLPQYECSNCGLKFRYKIEVKKITGGRNVEELKERIAPYFIQRTQSEILPELPSLVIENVFLELSPAQKKLYDQVKNSNMAIGAKVMMARQICDGPSLIGKPGTSVKLDYIKDLLENELASDKVVVFTNFLEMAAEVVRLCEKLGIGVVRLTGEEPFPVRDASVKKFQEDPKCRVVVGTTALEMSLNLQIAPVIIAADLVLNPSRVTQLYGRIRRIGSKHSSLTAINLFTKHTLECNFFEILARKAKMFNDIFSDGVVFEELSSAELEKYL